MSDDLALRMATRWVVAHPHSMAHGQDIHIADTPESRRSFCGLDRCHDTFRSPGDRLCPDCAREARAQMGRTLWSPADIARELGLASPAVARGWLRRASVRMIRRDPATDAKLYDPEQVRRAREAMPGQGSRTDLRSTPPFTPEEPAMTTSAADLRDQVARFLEAGDHGHDYDVDGIVEAIRNRHGLVDLDSIDTEDFNAILAANDTTP